LNGDYLGYSGRTVTANINNDLTSGEGPIADLERFNAYFRKVLKAVVSGRDYGSQIPPFLELPIQRMKRKSEDRNGTKQSLTRVSSESITD
jgi:hypothetical protein